MRRLLRLSVLLAFVGCADPAPGTDAGALPPAPAPEIVQAPPALPVAARPDPAPTPTFDAPIADEHITLPAGPLHVGSRPGLPGRRPSVEADLVTVAMPAVDIDRLPYPNDPERPAQLAATRREAAQLCEAAGRRLCTELEWERACRGTDERSFPTGETMDVAACVADHAACPSPEGVLDLGVRAPEWTASDASPRLAVLERTAVARGGRPDSSPASHRCGTRHAVNPAGGGRALAFRCCGSDAPAVEYPDVGVRRQFSDLELSDERWRTILASVEEVARFAEDFTAAGESDAVRALARGGAGVDEMHWELAASAFAWSPSVGEEVWVVWGASGDANVLIALYPLPGDRFAHAASFVVREEESSFAVLRDPATRRELLWSTCWSCGGENGAVRFDDEARLRIVQQ